jgi:mRNA interferase YafQ
MLKFRNTTKFRKDLKRIIKSGKDIDKFKSVANKLISQIPLDKNYYDHKLTGNYKDHRECHLEPDWLLIYYVKGDEITFVATGSHSYLFS